MSDSPEALQNVFKERPQFAEEMTEFFGNFMNTLEADGSELAIGLRNELERLLSVYRAERRFDPEEAATNLARSFAVLYAKLSDTMLTVLDKMRESIVKSARNTSPNTPRGESAHATAAAFDQVVDGLKAYRKAAASRDPKQVQKALEQLQGTQPALLKLQELAKAHESKTE